MRTAVLSRTPTTAAAENGPSTLIEYFGADGDLLFSGFAPPSPGNAGLSFFGIVFDDARIAAGPDHNRRRCPRAE
jgi:hypothetical protein